MRPDLVFGLVGPTGTDLDIVERKITESLQSVGYQTRTIRLSEELGEIPGLVPVFDENDVEKRLRSLMDAGTKLCERTQRKDIIAGLAISRMVSFRRTALSRREGDPAEEDDPSDYQEPQSFDTVYLLRGLKRPAEVDTLRLIYGPWFVLLAASASPERRAEDLAAQMGKNDPLATKQDRLSRARALMERDESEASKNEWGQNVSDTFPLSDVFFESANEDKLDKSVKRFIELLFGNRFHTPTRDEQAMCHAQVAAYRSSSLSRQVGAAITTPDGALLATGMNEVPRSGGGPYWCDDEDDSRDHRLPEKIDPSVSRRDAVLIDLLERLSPEFLNQEMRDSLNANPSEAVNRLWETVLKGAKLGDLTEFHRAVHAEMMALADVGDGTSVRDGYLYCTTFPCHLCARSIVASGLSRVYFIDPYPKSLVREMYSDSIELDHSEEDAHNEGDSRVRFLSFVGIAPRRYFDIFRLSSKERRESNGELVDWHSTKKNARVGVGDPRNTDPPQLQMAFAEANFLSTCTALISGLDLSDKEEES
jgi:deoxycytidylate deaminase